MLVIFRFVLFSSLIFLCSCLLAAERKVVLLATTTSIQDSGLLDKLVLLFEERSGYLLKAVVVGSGQALALGRKGEVDVLISHSPEEEKSFVDSGYGRRRPFAYNYYLLVGPKEDPCSIYKAKNAEQALKRIAEGKCPFFSRGDNSGTHLVEKKLWKKIGIDPVKEKWYQETGQGMAATLKIALEKKGYTLCDSATYCRVRGFSGFESSHIVDRRLRNIYSVIEVNPQKFKWVNEKGANEFSKFLFSDEVGALLWKLGKEKCSFPFFIPYERWK